jgi:AcrR family transcriptional regulator
VTEAAPRRRLRRSDRRAALLDAARRALVESGYEGASMEDIARHAGVSKTLVYHHFPNRQAVLIALLDEEHNRFLADLAQAISPGLTPRQMLERGIGAYFAAVERLGDAFPRFFGEIAARAPEFAERVDAIRDGVTQAVARVFEAEAPPTPEAERVLAARMLVGGVEAAAEEWRKRQELPRDRAAALCAALAWRGLDVDRFARQRGS